MNTTTSIQGKIAKRALLKRGLLSCGIASSVLYAAMLILVPMQWDDYSSASQTVSELSAIDAPTRALWVPPGMAYTLLMAIFGFGILQSAEENRYLKIVGTVIIIYGLIGIFWPPMHLREALAVYGPTMTDTLHIVWTIATVLLMLLGIGFGSMAFGKRFRIYSIVTILVLTSFGILTAIAAPRVQANLPTPMAGIWERINISFPSLGVGACSYALARRKK